jgi:hypothetical protein
MASFFSKEDGDYLAGQVTLSNFPFGKSEKDAINVSVFTFDGDQLTSSYFRPSGKNLAFTRSYYDVFTNYVEYSYTSYQSDLVIVGEETKSIFLDMSSQLENMGVQEGNYRVGIELHRDIVGDSSDSNETLIIDSISGTRTEVAVIPRPTRNQPSRTNTEFYAFATGSIVMTDVVDELVSRIKSPEIHSLYYLAEKSNPQAANKLMFNYGFRSGVDVANFLTDIYYGVRKGSRKSSGQFSTNVILGVFDQFSNWAYQNYNGSYTFEEIKIQYYSLFSYILNRELNGVGTKNPSDYDEIFQFLSEIFYNRIFYPAVAAVEVAHSEYISGYFKNYLNVDGKLLAILNTKVIPSLNPGRYHDKLVLKLAEPISDGVSAGGQVWITNTFASAPILQNVYYYANPKIDLVTLRGPNFLSRIESEGNSTEMVSIEGLIEETGSLYTELMAKLAKKNNSDNLRNVDYRYFENFITFSTAEMRLGAYANKVDTLNELTANIADLTAKLALQTNDEYYQTLLKEAQEEVERIKMSFDGYESFLYNNEGWYESHTADYSGESSASIYDSQNQSSLVNGLPSFILEDSLNVDYIKFVGMIGHYFDNLSLFIKQFTEKNDNSSSPNVGVSLDLVHNELVSLGWSPEMSRENLPLLLGAFSKSDFELDSPLYNKVGRISEDDRNKLIWKRILNTLPFIYKTKGTAASINALISCFGIPKNLLKIKEYGSIEQAPDVDEQGMYLFEENKYEPKFSGAGEYFQLPWNSQINSVEFSLRFDRTKTSTEGQVFRLVSCENNWVLGVYRDRGAEWGKLFLSIGDGSGSVISSMTDKVPFFDGNPYSVLFRKNDTQNTNDYPAEYELLVKKADSGRIIFTASSSLMLSGSANDVFQSGSNLFIGNYQQSTSSLDVDPEAFFGNIDEIKLWEVDVDDTSFEDHTLYFGGYNHVSPQTMVDKLLVRAAFSQPINLNDVTGTSSFSNLAFRKNYPTILAINFPPTVGVSEEFPECSLDDTPVYPYQFSINTVIQAAKVSSYGSQAMRSNKISFVEQSLVSPLSPSGRSTEQSSRTGVIGSNKIGVFFSPIDSQNEEILKFFGNYNFGDLIGDPQLVYKNSYREFERFRQIYYDQGFGAVDYQTFMNVVRAYFDKSMFKYISSVVPARSKLVDGILIEPSILERPKLQLKPTTVENIGQRTGKIVLKNNVKATNVGQPTGIIDVNEDGLAILNDINHRQYPDLPDQYCIGAFANNGVYFYRNDYFRVDIITDRKSYQTQREYNLPKGLLNDYERTTNIEGSVQTISRNYSKLNLIRLPIITEHPFTASIKVPGLPNPDTWYFSGSISIPLDTYGSGWVGYTVTSSHTIYGITTGSLWGFRQGDSTGPHRGNIVLPMTISASYYHISSSVVYSGYFTEDVSGYSFEGNIVINPSVSPNALSASQMHCVLYSESATSSIYQDIMTKTSQANGAVLFTEAKEITTRRAKSLELAPGSQNILMGYFPTHYKYNKQTFSHKEINSVENSYDQNGHPSPLRTKWKRGSQTKKTTVDPKTGNLNNAEPVERKTT